MLVIYVEKIKYEFFSDLMIEKMYIDLAYHVQVTSIH
jgi:hypothetical protein